MYSSPTEVISLESAELYPQYYRQFGVRRAVQLVAPTLIPMQKLRLPRDSILHFVSDDESMLGIPQDDMILRDNPRAIMVHHHTHLEGAKGNPRSTHLPFKSMAKEYHRKYRNTRELRNFESAFRDPRTLVVENYALLPHLYRYPMSFFRGYYKWSNIQATVWRRVGELAQVAPTRQQYIQCKLPRLLPSLQLLKRGEANVESRAVLDQFAEPEALFILEIWKWLGNDRANSLLGKLTAKELDNINLMWEESGVWTVINLGLLNSWRKPSEAEIKGTPPQPGADPKSGTIAPDQMQKRFLRMLMVLFEARTVADTGTPELTTDKPEHVIVAKGDDAPMLTTKTTSVKIKVETDKGPKTLTVKPGMDIDSLPEAPVEETPENVAAIDAAITKDLDALEHLVRKADEHLLAQQQTEPKAKPQVTAVVDYKPEERTLPGGVMAKADALADDGLLSGAEYRRFQTISTAYQNIPNPYGGEGTLADQAQLDPTTLKLEKKEAVPDIDTVLDKSMLQSSLFEFDKRYVKDVLPKDVSRMLLAFQNAGVAVTGYTVEEHQDALNHSELHTVQLTPVQGKASTIHFRLPKVDEDGTFKSNGVRCRMRKQRGDMPIRKLSPSRVALTSYYSKVFITRSEKQVHNYAGWLTNQIAAMGMNPEDTHVTNLMQVTDMFNSNHRTPRMYSIMAQRFRSFHVGKVELFFDYAARKAQFGEELVEKAEKGGLVVCGRFEGHLVGMDEHDTLYIIDKANRETRLLGDGQLTALLNISGKGPLEVAELKVFSKLIPVGMFLAYHMGLTNLMALLRVSPRRVPAGERASISSDEFALRFEDETLVFSRDNRLATLILAGLTSFEKSTRNYPCHLFDKRDIYFNVLEQSNIGVRFLREMDMLIDLFVDPITEELLKEMGEPTDFIGLVLRAGELLLTDWAPDETDMRYMRIKGYERMAGAVYGELVKVLRLQRARGASSKAKIELPPYAIWQAITQDPAVKLVEDANPIHNLKEREEITYAGAGGRSDRSMTAKTRVFHPSDMGVISEATKDSAAVAITTFLTADPNLTSLRGTAAVYEEGSVGPTSLLSSSALLAPSSDRDDQ